MFRSFIFDPLTPETHLLKLGAGADILVESQSSINWRSRVVSAVVLGVARDGD